LHFFISMYSVLLMFKWPCIVNVFF
jgi:hypothetical protein